MDTKVPRPRKQHYVTKAYLEGFLMPSKHHLVCYGRGGRLFKRSTEDLACQRNYYAVKKDDGNWDDTVEKLIDSSVESPGLPVIQKISSGDTKLSWQDRERLSLLIAFQEMRTPSARERVRTLSKLLNERVFHEIRSGDPNQTSVKIVGESGTSVVTLDEMADAHEVICDDHSMEIHRPLLGSALELSKQYRHMKFMVYYATGNDEFITTDTPVIRVFTSGAPLGSGINRPDIEIRFPLSRQAFLTLTHDAALVEKLKRASAVKRSQLLDVLPEIRIKYATSAQVAAFNKGHARHTHQWLFASREFEWVVNMLNAPSAAPRIMDLSGPDLIHFQSSVSYDPKIDTEPK